MQRLLKLLYFVIVLILITGCNNTTNIDVGKALVEAEKEIELLEGVTETSSSFNNDDNTIKFRIMVEKSLTQQQAETKINEFLEKIALNSKEEVWNYYSASFDIKKDNGDILFEGTKQIGDENITLKQK